MKNTILFFLVLFSLGANAQISSVNFVQIVNDNSEEAYFYYENNWKKLREEAVKRGFIESYQLIKLEKSEESDIDIILITNYGSETQSINREENFRLIMKDLQPNGPTFMNDKKSSDFRKVLEGRDGNYWK